MRRTALIARELQRYNVDITALCETRFSEIGQLSEVGGGYTFFWKGKPEGEPRQAGVGFAMRTNLVNKLENLPVGLTERLIRMRLPLSKDRYATLIAAYAPTLTSTDEDKQAFYEDLNNFIKSTPKDDKLLILGDLNARVGRDYQQWSQVLGRHGVGNMNENGLLLLSTCAEHKLAITNTMFQLPNKHKTIWMHPRSKHWNMIDYIIVRQQDIRDVRITRVMRGADCNTDHRLIRSKMHLFIRPTMRKTANGPRKLNTEKLKDQAVASSFREELAQALRDQTMTQETWSPHGQRYEMWCMRLPPTTLVAKHANMLTGLMKTTTPSNPYSKRNERPIRSS